MTIETMFYWFMAVQILGFVFQAIAANIGWRKEAAAYRRACEVLEIRVLDLRRPERKLWAELDAAHEKLGLK
jgi:hypothetical protein